jgi:co-chaperonin GroES (HSP10)
MNQILKPIDDRIFVEVVKEDRTRRGVFLAGKKGPRLYTGNVIAVGPGLPHKNGRHPPTLKPGDRIIFGTASEEQIELWLDVEIDGKKLKMMRERDVQAKIA